MRSFWSDPYLWVHLAGLATVPIWLELCLLALAVGDPILPVWLELFLIGGGGIAPTVWMQWQRPFNIYSLLALRLKPEQLTEEQRKLLTRFTAPRNRFLAVGVAVLMAIALAKLFVIAPIAAPITPFAGSGRGIALLLAAIAFLGANLFTQVPVAVMSVMVTSEATYAATLPFAIEQVRQQFLGLGFPVNQILPPLVVAASATPTSPVAQSLTTATPPSAPPVVADLSEPLNSDDLDDIWGEESQLQPPEQTSDAVDRAGVECADLTEKQPAAEDVIVAADAIAAAVKATPLTMPSEGTMPEVTVTEVTVTEATVTEATVTEATVTEVTVTEAIAADVEESWLDAPAVDDPASAEPPNAL